MNINCPKWSNFSKVKVNILLQVTSLPVLGLHFFQFQLSVFAFLIIVTRQLAVTVVYVSDNSATANEVSQENVYAGYPQEYYLSQTYKKKYIPQSENQIQTAAELSETLLSPGYQTPVTVTEQVVSQVTKPPKVIHGNQSGNPYSYATEVIPQTVSHGSLGSESNCEVPKKYHYGYRVSNPYMGTEFGHSEVNDGRIAKGYYHVLLPDGRLQNVRYWAGPFGYHATITYETKY